jgi:ribonuclease P protein component
MNFRFPKSEKLKSKKTIELLFEEGKSVSKYPVKMFYLPSKNAKKNTGCFCCS